MFQGSRTNSFAALIAVIALSCSVTVRAQSGAASDMGLSGHWQGTRSATGGSGSDAFKVHNISFDLTQNGEDLTGTYRCYAGKKANTECNNPVGNITSGKIKDGKINIKIVAQPNNLQCTFDGSVDGGEMAGSFTCYVSGGLESNGVFKIHRKE